MTCRRSQIRIYVAASLRKFCEICMPGSFRLEWTHDRLQALSRIESAILHNQPFFMEMRRGRGKTIIAIASALWAVLCGHKKYVAMIYGDGYASIVLHECLRRQLETCDLFYELFPEAIHPIRRLEGIAIRCRSQTYDGRLTHISLGHGVTQFATIPYRGEPTGTASGAIIQSASVMADVQNLKTILPDGSIAVPDLLVFDDPQTDHSASSSSESCRRLNVITSLCPGLANPSEPSASGYMLCSGFKINDVPHQLAQLTKSKLDLI